MRSALAIAALACDSVSAVSLHRRGDSRTVSPEQSTTSCSHPNGCSWEYRDVVGPGTTPHASLASFLMAATDETCFNGCSGDGLLPAGNCVLGVCHYCSTQSLPHNSSYDCAPDKPPYPSDKTKGFVYVYDLDADLGLRQTREAHQTADAIYGSEYAFFERLMSDWSVRVQPPLDPNQGAAGTRTKAQQHYTSDGGLPQPATSDARA